MSVIIVVSDTDIVVNGKSYPKGSIRPVYTGDNVELIFPWWNNQSIIPPTNWANITGNGGSFTSQAGFVAFAQGYLQASGLTPVPAAQFVIGDGQPATPLNGTATYLNPRMTAASKVSLNGMGYLTLGTDYTFVTGGGFTLIGTTFATDQVYVVFY